MIPNRDTWELRKQAWQQRHNPTRAEYELWQHLRSKQMGATFRRQARKLGYILDFWCPRAKLAVELDGSRHDPNADAKRDHHLAGWGITVLRLPNHKPLEDMLETIRAVLAERGVRGKPVPVAVCPECHGTTWLEPTPGCLVRCRCWPERLEDWRRAQNLHLAKKHGEVDASPQKGTFNVRRSIPPSSLSEL